jgi:hypothetical protein
VNNLEGLIPIVKASALNSAKLAFRVAILNTRENRNHPQFGDGFAMQQFTGVARKNIPASWESTSI